MNIILGQEEEQSRNDTSHEIFASELFQMQNNENYQSHLLDQQTEG